ncbi:venom serine carboxypeptidase-like [Epargyreus clarus]|uniref:venom serine carboxypeptidase-like n=1 Tax=Epargyreus clarus TaxID=520877 RepID=UPI003C2C699E
MTRTVILVVALFVANCHGKVAVTEDNLRDPSINVISKHHVADNSYIHIDLPTKTSSNLEDLLKKVIKLDADNKISESDANIIIRIDTNTQSNDDNGEALILTPLLEKGLIEEARNASRVDRSLFLGFESYSGFFTVNKTYNSNVFFWYFPVINKPVNETPWIIWLQGGPGASSLTGLFDEIGPFKGSADSLKPNPYTWLQNHSLLFIDNPIGSGFSFTDHADGFVKDMATYSKHLYSTVKQFIQVFPELRVAPLFVGGESYAGKYVPALAMEIHKHKNNPGQDINLQGVLLGNGYVDPAMISQVTQPFLYFGLLEKKQIEALDPLLKAFQNDIANNNSVGAKNKWMSLITALLFLTHQKQAYNFLKDEMPFGRYSPFLKKPEIKKAIHVGSIRFAVVNLTTNMEMAPDFLSSSKPIFEKLLEDYRVLAYCGQLDQMLPCVYTSENYRTWKWNGTEQFLEATRYPFLFNNKLAGYNKSGGGLTEVVVRGAGHMVPVDAPAAAQELITRWTHGMPLSQPAPLLEGSFLRQFVANNSAIYL